jgi:elongation factor P--(R)-beta-lysine ligase
MKPSVPVPVPVPVATPSQLRGSGQVRVGGRIREITPAGARLADALAAVEVTFATPPDLRPGDLVLVDGHFRDGTLQSAHLVELVHRPTDHAATLAESTRLGSIAPALRTRAAVAATVRAFFAARDYLEVETPALVPSPGLDLHLDAFAVAGGAYLGTSPEYQMKRLVAGGLPRTFQLARCFRRAEHGDRHNREFTMLEWYRGWSTMEEVMDETEALVRTVLDAHAAEQMPIVREPCDWRRPFLRLTVAAAFERYAGVSQLESLRLAIVDETRWFRLLVDAVEPALARLGTPVFLHDYPAPFASLARLRPDDLKVCERFELYFGDLELCNGFGELVDPYEQRGRLLADQEKRAAAGKPVHPLDERFLAALAEGMPPSAGNALGLDRLVALCTGAASIADVLTFPAELL